MIDGEKSKTWWTYERARTRWALVGCLVIAWLVAAVLLYPEVVRILAARPWWQDFVVAVATAAVPVLAILELRHSGEANNLRKEANDERRNAYLLSKDNARLAAELDGERNKHLAQIAINTARSSQEPAASLKIYPANRSRYILKPAGQGGIHGDFRSGHFQFWLRVENKGNRNSAVDRYKLWIQEFDREFDGIVPMQIKGLVPGRHCQYAIGNEKYLNEANLIQIPADNSTNVGCIWFYLPELTLDMFANAGLRMQGPERRFGNLHCRLTITDSNGVSASEDFECHED